MSTMEYSTEIKELVEQQTDVIEVSNYDLVVYNDDFNTFDHVTNTLIKVCKHAPQQAEQCTWIIHYKGKCSVKKGGYEELEPMKNSILDAGIDAKIH